MRPSGAVTREIPPRTGESARVRDEAITIGVITVVTDDSLRHRSQRRSAQDPSLKEAALGMHRRSE